MTHVLNTRLEVEHLFLLLMAKRIAERVPNSLPALRTFPCQGIRGKFQMFSAQAFFPEEKKWLIDIRCVHIVFLLCGPTNVSDQSKRQMYGNFRQLQADHF